MKKKPSLEPLHAIETASIDELRQLQFDRLKSSLNHAYTNSSAYKQKFEAHGVHADDLTCLEDIAKFPFTTKADLRENYPFNFFAVPMEQVIRVHASSGTTGKPTVVGYTKKDIENWSALMARSIRAAGGNANDLVHVSYGYGLFTGGLGAHYGGEHLGCTVIPMSGGQTEKQVQLIQDFDPDIIMVTPSYMLNLADEMERQGVDPHKLALRAGIFGAEPWTHAMREELEQRLDIDAVDIYGLSEVMGPGVAQECVSTKDGPTIWEDHFYPEIVNPDTGEICADGEEGELVFTSLLKEAMPVIRYRTRDLTKLLPGTARVMRRMEKITVRCDDTMIIRGVNVFPSQREEHLLATNGLSPHYFIELRKEGHLDAMEIHVELASTTDGMSAEDISQSLKERVKLYVGISAVINVHALGQAPRSEGKAKRIIDKRN